MPFHRIAIVNRGEPAMRFINAVAELNRESGRRLTTIALYTDPDRHAWFVREADEAVCIGPATTFDERAGREVQTYLDHERLERALVATGAEAAWAGYATRQERWSAIAFMRVPAAKSSGDCVQPCSITSKGSACPR